MYSKEKYFGTGSVPIGVGGMLKGRDIIQDDFINPNQMKRVVDFRAMTAKCLHDCFFCFTDKLKNNLSLQEIKNIIDQCSDLGVKGINYLGEGEPTLDKNFFEILNYTKNKGIQAIVFTDAGTKLTDKNFVKQLKETGASVCPKCDSLWNAEYQNWVVGDKTNNYFSNRNQAIENLVEAGFNKIQDNGTTRLGFDMVLTKKNKDEVEKTLRYCRENNIWIIFSYYLPSGRSGKEDFDQSLTLDKQEKEEIQNIVQKIDQEYGFTHKLHTRKNFLTMPCVEFMQILGNGDITSCPGNDTAIGNIRCDSIKEGAYKILKDFPKHNCKQFDGDCLYR